MTGGFADSQRHRQGGAIAILAAILLPVAILFLVLAIDSGRLYVQQRALQRVADAAALSAAARGGVCAPIGQQDDAAVQSLARQAAEKNGFDIDADRTLTARLGGVRVVNGLREFDPDSEANDTVEVVVTHRVPTSIIANLARLIPGSEISDTIVLRAEAVARRNVPTTAALSAGTGLLRLNTNSSPLLQPLLKGALGSQVDLSLVAYDGIARTGISLLELAKGLMLAGVNLALGTIEEVLDARVTVLDLVRGSIEALKLKGDGENVRASLDLLNALAAVGIGVDVPEIRLGDILEVDTPDHAPRDHALNVDLDLIDLVGAAILAANQRNAISLRLDSGALLDQLAVKQGSDTHKPKALKLELYIIEPPRIKIGPAGPLVPPQGDQHWRTEVQSAQVRLNVGTELNLLGLLEVDLGLAVTAAGGKAALEKIDCGIGSEAVVHVLAKPALASIALGSFESLENPNSPVRPAAVRLLESGHSSLLTVNISANSVASDGGSWAIRPGENPLEFRGPFPAESQRVTGESGKMLGGLLRSLTDTLEIRICLLSSGDCDLAKLQQCRGLGCLLNKLLNLVLEIVVGLLQVLSDVLAPLLELLGAAVLDPLLKLLGIELGSVDVSVLGVDISDGVASVELVR